MVTGSTLTNAGGWPPALFGSSGALRRSVEPLGVVIETRNFTGRIIFEAPVLLPDEQFLELDLLRRRTHGRLRHRR